MDDLPSRAAERSASASTPRGIYDFASDFRPVYREIVPGVKDANLRGIGREERLDLLQDVFLSALKIYRSDPDFFGPGVARRWARVAAQNRFADLKREARRDVIADQALQREAEAGNVYVPAPDFIEKEERTRAVRKAWQVITPRSRAVFANLLRGLSRRESAADLGVSEKAVKKELEKARRELRLELSDWNPRGHRR